jgi:tripeptide aminopeptidase
MSMVACCDDFLSGVVRCAIIPMSSSPRPDATNAVSWAEGIGRLAQSAEFRSACSFLRSHEDQFSAWQAELSRIPAPPFGESARAEWFRERFAELELEEAQIDEVGNVFGILRGAEQKFVALSAHLDTVFPAGTPLNIRQQAHRLYGPGVSDNGAGLTALLAIAATLAGSKIPLRGSIAFIANVGEEGEGDLRGMRHIFSTPRWKDSIRTTIVLDGAGSDTIVSEALGSRRFEVIVRGPGGHSWSDFGAPNPILVLARTLHLFAQTPLPSSPKTTFNVGVIRGGTSVNSIPESASMRVDIRSTSMAEMERLEASLRRALEFALEEETRTAERRSSNHRRSSALGHELVDIGNRPAGELDGDSRLLQVIRAVDAHLGNAAQIQRASTDANIPLSMGREAIAIGGGGTGGGAHTLQEWFDSNGRELGLKRILLTVLALAGLSNH